MCIGDNMSEYEDIFAKRGVQYHTAMLNYPYARDAEFAELFMTVDTSTIRNLADIPAGGGYLQRFIPEDCVIDSFEPCTTFNSKNYIDLENLMLPDNHYDAVVNLAAIHHIKNKQPFVNTLFNALKPQGYLFIADVMTDTGIAYFLDEFAGKYNGTGHRGDYLTADSIANMKLPTNHRIIENTLKPCYWTFNSKKDLICFCKLLFGLNNLPDDVLFNELNNTIGITYQGDNLYLLWQLLYIVIQKN